jgi:hypothetical protein
MRALVVALALPLLAPAAAAAHVVTVDGNGPGARSTGSAA